MLISKAKASINTQIDWPDPHSESLSMLLLSENKTIILFYIIYLFVRALVIYIKVTALCYFNCVS